MATITTKRVVSPLSKQSAPKPKRKTPKPMFKPTRPDAKPMGKEDICNLQLLNGGELGEVAMMLLLANELTRDIKAKYQQKFNEAENARFGLTMRERK